MKPLPIVYYKGSLVTPLGSSGRAQPDLLQPLHGDTPHDIEAQGARRASFNLKIGGSVIVITLESTAECCGSGTLGWWQ